MSTKNPTQPLPNCQLETLKQASPSPANNNDTEPRKSEAPVMTLPPAKSTISRSPTLVLVLHRLCIILLLLFLIIWLVKLGRGDNLFNTFGLDSFADSTVGSQFSQGVAKLIDLACSAILAPSLMVVLNILFFTAVRTSVLNDGDKVCRQQAGVPLKTVITASSLDTGSYDIFKVIKLLRGRT